MKDLVYIKNYLDFKSSNNLFKTLSSLPFASEKICIFGKWVKVPRRVLFIADKGIEYKYSNIRHTAFPWPACLQKLRQKIFIDFGVDFNAVLLNYYEDGKDYMGWHSDDERELGLNPCILSLSLGASRRFLLKHKITKIKKEYLLHSGSVLIMKGSCQKDWQHTLPKMLSLKDPRVNLTFRFIKS